VSNYITPYSALDDQTFPEGTLMMGKAFSYKAIIDINICDLTSGSGKIVELDDIAKEEAWIVNSRSNLWQAQAGPVNFSIEPVDRVTWVDPPIITDCSVQGTLVGFAYEVLEIPSDPEFPENFSEMIPNVGDGEYQMWLSILVEDPEELLGEGDVITGIKPNEILGFENKINVYPNPTNDLITVSCFLDKPSMLDIDLFSISGGLIKDIIESTQVDGQYQTQFDISNLSSGVYICRVRYDKGVANVKILKQ